MAPSSSRCSISDIGRLWSAYAVGRAPGNASTSNRWTVFDPMSRTPRRMVMLLLLRSFDGAFGPFLGEQFEGLALGDLFWGGTAGHGHVGGAVGNIRAKSAFFDHDFLARRRVIAEFANRRFGLTPAPSLFGLRVNFLGLRKRDGK